MILTTKIFVASFVLIAILYDIFAVSKAGSDATISVVTYNWSRSKYGPLIVFLCGALVYHLFINP